MSKALQGVRGVACSLVVATATFAAGCARYAVEPVAAGGSLKDPIAGAPSKPAAKVKVAKKSAALASSATAPTPASARADKGTETPANTPRADRQPPGASPAPAAAQPAAGSPATAAPSGTAMRTSPPPDERAASLQLLADGQQLFVAGKVLEARRRFIAALTGSAPEATWALAQSFDPYYLAQLARHDASADGERALALYRSAVERGARAAQGDLDRLRTALAQRTTRPAAATPPPSPAGTGAEPRAAEPPAVQATPALQIPSPLPTSAPSGSPAEPQKQ